MDKEVIFEKIEFIEKTIEKLKKYLEEYDLTETEFKREYLLNAIERISEIIIESAIKVNFELLKSSNEIPKTYHESFVKLEDLNIFDKEILNKLVKTVGFRNRLAHKYIELDDKITISTAKTLPKLYTIYIKNILKYLKKN